MKVPPLRILRLEIARHEGQQPHEHGHLVVDLVCHSPSQLPDRLHPGKVAQPLPYPQHFGYVLEREQDGAAVWLRRRQFASVQLIDLLLAVDGDSYLVVSNATCRS